MVLSETVLKILCNTALGRMPTDSSSLNRAYPTSTVSEAASGCDDERPRRKEQAIRTGNQGPPAVTVPALPVRQVARRQQPAGLAHR